MSGAGAAGGLPLTEVLRRRRKLAPSEVTWLLRELPGQLDEAGGEDSGVPLINETSVHFARPGADCAGDEVQAWPHFTLHWQGGGTQSQEATRLAALPFTTAPVRLAALVYELLGGRLRPVELLAGRYSPLGELGEAGNAFLQRALHPGAYASARAVWEAWCRVLSATDTGASSVLVPRPGTEQPGELLDLLPLDGAAAPTRLVAAARFRIGRSRSLADLVTRSPEGSDEQAGELSRVHLTGVCTETGPAFLDGDGREPSANGSAWSGRPLSLETPAAIAGSGELLLSPRGRRYSLSVVPLRSPPAVDGTHLPSPFGAIAFVPAPGMPVSRHALWLFCAAGAEISPAGELMWSDAAVPAQIFLRRVGCFWIARTGPEAAVTLSDSSLGQGERAPLCTGQTLTLGSTRFLVKVSAD